MKIEIKKWLTGEIIFAHDAEENSIKLTLEAGVKVKADFCKADLTGADLTGAYLTGAYLRGAEYENIKINKAPISILNLAYFILVFESHMKIGCEFHSHAEWGKFTDREIAKMDGKTGLRFWHENKLALMKFCEVMAKNKKDEVAK